MMNAGTSWRSVLHKLRGTFSARGVLWTLVWLDKNYGLRSGDLESLPATHVTTREHVVDPHQVIAGFLKASAIHLVGAFRRGCFPGSLEPAYVVFGTFTAVRAAIRGLFNFLFFVKEISFVHKQFHS